MSIQAVNLDQPAELIEAEISALPKLLIHFSAPSCNVCTAVGPRVEALAEEHGWPIVDINVETHMEVAAQRLVFTVPTILVLAEGKEMLRESRFIAYDKIDRIMGLMAD
ncbi:MAG: thioredoxin family protein [Eubacteriales bacterium]|nr:thioredoxin family protein [Eubacteriales bacterium]